jgi:hypothetical protein
MEWNQGINKSCWILKGFQWQHVAHHSRQYLMYMGRILESNGSTRASIGLLFNLKKKVVYVLSACDEQEDAEAVAMSNYRDHQK